MTGKSEKYLLDFDDLLLETYLLLSTNNNIRDKYADRLPASIGR